MANERHNDEAKIGVSENVEETESNQRGVI